MQALRNLSLRIGKFGVVGVANTLVDFLVFAALSAIGMNYAVAQVVAYSAGMANSFVWNRRWTFAAADTRPTVQQVLGFVAVNLASLGASVIVLTALTEWLSVHLMLAKVVAIGVTQVVNFVGYQRLVFGTQPKEMLTDRPAG